MNKPEEKHVCNDKDVKREKGNLSDVEKEERCIGAEFFIMDPFGSAGDRNCGDK